MSFTDLADREGWRVDGPAARVHYRGDGEHYSVEYYAPSDHVIYWQRPDGADTAVPIARERVPDGLRARIRADLSAVGLDPTIEAQPV